MCRYLIKNANCFYFQTSFSGGNDNLSDFISDTHKHNVGGLNKNDPRAISMFFNNVENSLHTTKKKYVRLLIEIRCLIY